jgi:hypothetical protein
LHQNPTWSSFECSLDGSTAEQKSSHEEG